VYLSRFRNISLRLEYQLRNFLTMSFKNKTSQTENLSNTLKCDPFTLNISSFSPKKPVYACYHLQCEDPLYSRNKQTSNTKEECVHITTQTHKNNTIYICRFQRLLSYIHRVPTLPLLLKIRYEQPKM
jgi:hypothetical protein